MRSKKLTLTNYVRIPSERPLSDLLCLTNMRKNGQVKQSQGDQIFLGIFLLVQHLNGHYFGPKSIQLLDDSEFGNYNYERLYLLLFAYLQFVIQFHTRKLENVLGLMFF